ncbi:MAG: single- stranded DNA-binding family protein [Pyrobaculum sp.]
MAWKLEENVQRDIEKAQENIELYGGYVLKAPNRHEIRTGVIIAARFADKIRRAIFAAFGHVAPKEEIVKTIAELNKRIYEKLTSMGVGKLDVVRISVEIKANNGKLTFGEPHIEWFIPYTEIQKRIEECEKKIAEIREKIESLLKEL